MNNIKNPRLEKFRSIDATETDPLCEQGLIDYDIAMRAYGAPKKFSHDQNAVRGYGAFKVGLAHYMMHEFSGVLFEPDPIVQGEICRAAINVTAAERKALLDVFTFEKAWNADWTSAPRDVVYGAWYAACNAALREI